MKLNIKLFLLCSALSAKAQAHCEMDTVSGYLTESSMLSLMNYPKFESIEVAFTDLNIETRVCYKVSGCSVWQNERNSRVKSILTDSSGKEIARQNILKFTAKKDRAWVSFVMDSAESMLFVPSTSSSDRTIVPGILFMGQRLGLGRIKIKPPSFNYGTSGHLTPTN